jgi:hypothetical protein
MNCGQMRAMIVLETGHYHVNQRKKRRSETMEFNMQPAIGLCTIYMEEAKGPKSETSIVVDGKKVIVNEAQTQVNFINGCSMFKSCHNPKCWYSMAARQLKRT